MGEGRGTAGAGVMLSTLAQAQDRQLSPGAGKGLGETRLSLRPPEGTTRPHADGRRLVSRTGINPC